KVSEQRMLDDLNYLNTRTQDENAMLLHYTKDPYEAMKDSFAIAVITEWDEFVTYDWNKVFSHMLKPAYIFDGRNILDHDKLRKIGFIVKAIGK
ncbi:MAG: UDP binding domain-containing protein, partial [Melioribacteraceae bacterium]